MIFGGGLVCLTHQTTASEQAMHGGFSEHYFIADDSAMHFAHALDGGVHALGCGSDAARLLDGEYSNLDSIECAAHPGSD